MKKDLLFEVIEPSGKKYEIFTSGRISGFAEGSIICNLFTIRSRQELSNLSASACPSNTLTDSLAGMGQSDGP